MTARTTAEASSADRSALRLLQLTAFASTLDRFAMPRAIVSPATSCTPAEAAVAIAASSRVIRSVRTRPSRSETMPHTGCIAPYAK